MNGIPDLVARIHRTRAEVPERRSVLVALSGIDGAGKGHVAGRLAGALARIGLRTAVLHADGWLNLPHRRFDPANPAEHFYLNAFRFEEMLATLVLPLRDRRTLRLEADFTEETATAYRRHVYAYHDVDVIVLEGIFLLKRSLRPHYDLSVWIECSFETALERATARAQEGLPPETTRRAYETIYFPAQRIHFERDEPRGAAMVRLANDPRLAPLRGSGRG